MDANRRPFFQLIKERQFSNHEDCMCVVCKLPLMCTFY